MSPNIDIHDFNTKLKNVTKYLEKGHKIKMFIKFRGREAMHHELGKQVLIRFANSLKEVADIEQEPKLDGRTMAMLIVPKEIK